MFRSALREYRTWAMDSRRWAQYEPHPGDVIIATASKCGTTWMQQIVSSLVFQDGAARALAAISPWIEGRAGASAASIHRALGGQTHRRFLKTHLPVDALPLHDEVRYIHVARDGRDAVMSMHNHFTGFPDAQIETFDRIGLEDPLIARLYPRLPVDPAEFFRLWISTAVVAGQTDGMPEPSFFDLVVGYWAGRLRSNFLMVHYNDLRENLDAQMRRIAAFLEIGVNDAVWPSLVRAARFEVMREAGDALMPQTMTLSGGSRRFFNQGTSGRWRDVLTSDDLALYDAKVREKFTPGLARWIAGGQRAVGDPRMTQD